MLNIKATSTVIVLVGAVFGFGQSAQAGTVVQCGEDLCPVSFSIKVDGGNMEAGGGQFLYDAKTGDIVLDTENNIRGGGVVTQGGGLMWNMGDGASIRVDNIYGNADPIVGFGLGASAGSSSKSYAFSFDLPIALSGSILAESSVSYSLTSTTNVGAQITPTIGNTVVHASEVDTSIGGLPSMNKGVDVGEQFFVLGGPKTANSPVYTATNYIVGDLDYDQMAVVVAFSLSANSNVGLSGFVSQTEVPVPAAFWMFSAALGLTGFAARKKKLS